MPPDTNQRATTEKIQDFTEISVTGRENSENKQELLKIIL